MPSSLQLNGELFSNYKNHTTLKGLVGISLGGAITFVSQLYTRSISDREIVRGSGLLDLPFQDKDSVMVDKGFTISDLLPLDVSLNLPPFLGGQIKCQQRTLLRPRKLQVRGFTLNEQLTRLKTFISGTNTPSQNWCCQPNVDSVCILV